MVIVKRVMMNTCCYDQNGRNNVKFAVWSESKEGSSLPDQQSYPGPDGYQIAYV